MKRRILNLTSVKHIPQRTCIACGKIRPKRELVRLVRVSPGGVEVDPGGKQAGRGAYLCPVGECWQIGLKKGRLEHTLGTTLTPDNRARLIRYGQELG
jgi:hypothetical protein